MGEGGGRAVQHTPGLEGALDPGFLLPVHLTAHSQRLRMLGPASHLEGYLGPSSERSRNRVNSV